MKNQTGSGMLFSRTAIVKESNQEKDKMNFKEEKNIYKIKKVNSSCDKCQIF